jgi:cytochrome P450
MTPHYSHLEHANDLEPSEGHRILRETCPIHKEDHDPPFRVVSRYDDVLSVLKSSQVWGNREGPGIYHQPGGVLGSADNPNHKRQRSALRAGFTPSVIARMQPRVEEICDTWWKAFNQDGEGDFVELFAFPYPAVVIAELLGVPDDRRDDFRRWSNDTVAGLGGGDTELLNIASAGIYETIGDGATERMELADAGKDLPDDLLSIMVTAYRNGDIGWSEILQLGHQLLVAGHETTASLISLMLYRLIQQPELADQLRDRPDLLEAAVEEFARFDSPVQGLFRTSQDDDELLGEPVDAHTKVQVLFASANRDPDAFAEPDTIDFEREGLTTRQHVAFGWGVHYCIGAPLARREALVALDRIVNHFKTVELLAEPEVNAPFILRGFSSMPIRWTV